ncbi:MAG TPA: 2,3-bisphosphoglycerate-independent phosphoglycerate mutase, partial [Myxococcota bacterium]
MSELKLKPHARLQKPKGPVLEVVLDGVGLGCGDDYDAVARADMPNLKRLSKDGPRSLQLKAHGTAVGLPTDDDMGNSEVGHNALGSGRIVLQGASLVDSALASGKIFADAGFQKLASAFTKHGASSGGTFHIIGLLSDGGVHSRLDQILGVIDGAVARGAKKIRMHALLDGRDVPDHSAQKYLDEVEQHFAKLRDKDGKPVDAKIASGGGRMFVTMDRYESDWSMVERGWHAHVLGDARAFASPRAAIDAFRAEKPGISDQQLPAFVVVDEHNKPVGTIEDGDAVLFANF